MLTQYRIKRHDNRNIVIQRQVSSGLWTTVSYHGNSLNSLILGVAELIVSQHVPIDDNLPESLEKLRLEYVRGLETIEEIIRNSSILDCD